MDPMIIMLLGAATISAVTSIINGENFYGTDTIVIKKYRFDKDTIDYLLKFKWWDKDIETIKKIIPYIANGECNIKDILEKFGE